jgi:hypothetical protein
VTTQKEKTAGRKLSDSEDKQKIISLDKGKVTNSFIIV